MAKRTRRFNRISKIVSVLLALTFAVLLIDYGAYPYWDKIGGRTMNSAGNGLWLRYTWYFGQYNATETKGISQRLIGERMAFAYFHVRSIGKDGKLEHRLPKEAKTLTDTLHHDCHGVKLIAWVYASGDMNMADARTRTTMVSEAAWLVRTCGFDGVQWDVEPCPDGDSSFISLLKETKHALPQNAFLSVASPMWQPATLKRFGWSDAYFTKVAAYCDQIAVMCYDSGFYMPRTYVWLVSQQAIHVTSAVATGNPNCRVTLGVPTYGAGLPSHNPRAETLTNAIRGVREGLEDSRANLRTFSGIALFADYTTTNYDWDVYNRLWLGK